jgi:hypothetical protein
MANDNGPMQSCTHGLLTEMQDGENRRNTK